MKKSEIIEAIHKGIRAANKKYEKWTRGWWLTDSGVEGLLVAGIAEAVSKRQNEHESLLMEASYSYITEHSGAKTKRWPPSNMYNKGARADIVLFNTSDQPTCVIEAKRFWDRNTCLKDLKRIESLVRKCSRQKNGSLRRGFLALMLVKGSEVARDAREDIERQLRDIKKIVDSSFGKNEHINVGYEKYELWSWPKKYQELFQDARTYQGVSLCIEMSSRNLKD